MSDSDSEPSSRSSEDSFCSENEDFQSYDASVDPIANEQKAAEYAIQIAQEKEEENMIFSRFAGETVVEDCGVCSVFTGFVPSPVFNKVNILYARLQPE